MSKPNSYVVFENDVLVVIVSGFTRKSKNSKVGSGALNTWTMVKRMNPVQAINSGADKDICDGCSLRTMLVVNKKGQRVKRRRCYVRVHQAPLSLWKAWTKGNIPTMLSSDIATMFSGRFVRFGAYGEPTKLPIELVRSIASVARDFTGYTHNWKNPAFQGYRDYFSASCDNEQEHFAAIALGWKPFTVSAKPITGAMLCPASKEFEAIRGYKLQCVDCGACGGKSAKGRPVWIAPHGAGKGSFDWAVAA